LIAIASLTTIFLIVQLRTIGVVDILILDKKKQGMLHEYFKDAGVKGTQLLLKLSQKTYCYDFRFRAI
jgi:hypothetical protein